MSRYLKYALIQGRDAGKTLSRAIVFFNDLALHLIVLCTALKLIRLIPFNVWLMHENESVKGVETLQNIPPFPVLWKSEERKMCREKV